MSTTSLPHALARRLPGPTSAAGKTMVLAIILGTYLMIVLDVSVVITALPDIHRALDFSDTGLTWVQNAYTLTFGGLLLLGARAGDILGRRRVFIGGVTLFTFASLLGGLAQSAAWLLAARGVQGVGAAIAAPSTLALLTTSFREGPERARAIAAYGAVAGAGGSVGLVLGGVLTAAISWRWGLFLNVPVGIVLVALAPVYLPETERSHGRFDLPGAITSSLGMSTVVYGFVRAAADGWGDPITLASFAASIGLLGAFVATELRAEQPITPLRLFASRQRSGAFAARTLIVGAMFSMFFFLTQFLQGVSGFSPLQAGLAFLPMSAVMFTVSRFAGRLQARHDDATVLVGGLALALVGMAWLSRLGDGSAYLSSIAIPLALLGTGMGIAFAPLTSAALTGVQPEDAGAASGLVNVSQQLGGALGVGILVTVFAAANHGAAATAQTPAGRHALAHAIGSSLTGSAIFLALALCVAGLVMRPPTSARAVLVRVGLAQ